MKRFKNNYGFFLNKLLKMSAENSEILSQKPKVEETFSPSYDMIEDVSSY